MAFECRQLRVTPYDLEWEYMCQIGGFGIKITKKRAESTIPASTNRFCWRSFLKSGIVYMHSMRQPHLDNVFLGVERFCVSKISAESHMHDTL